MVSDVIFFDVLKRRVPRVSPMVSMLNELVSASGAGETDIAIERIIELNIHFSFKLLLIRIVNGKYA